MENAQRRATRLVPELRGLTYKESLIELNLPTLDYRRKRFDIIQVFKIVHKIDDIDMSTFFTFTENNQLRGHNLKLQLHSFSLRNFPVWNSLPLEVVNSKTVVEFKTKLDKLWRSQRFDQTNIY